MVEEFSGSLASAQIEEPTAAAELKIFLALEPDSPATLIRTSKRGWTSALLASLRRRTDHNGPERDES